MSTWPPRISPNEVALSNVHAVRSRDTAFGAVVRSLQLVFEQMWRVVLPTYVLIVLVIVLSFLVMFLAFAGLTPGFGRPRMFFGTMVSVSSVAYSVAMTFVLERTYAPELTLLGDAAAAPPSTQPRGGDAAVPAG